MTLVTFDKVALKEYKENENNNLEKIRHQRGVCGVILTGMLFCGFKMDHLELQLVHKVNRMTTPAPEWIVKKLEKIKERRWK